MSVKIQIKRTTASAWTSLNPTLDNGEFGYETDTAKFKIGNGSTAWTSLAYANANLSVASLDALSDVTITSATNGDFLRWNGSAWINDAVNLSTDTVGSYVESLVAGTGVTVTNNSGEGAAPTIAIGQDVASSAIPTFAGLNLNGNIVFEGATANDFETTLAITDPTSDRTITFPDLTGTVVTTGDTGSVTSLMIADGTIVNADVNASAAIAYSKLANATAGQVLLGTTTPGVVTATTISGDITIDGAGVASISANSVALGTDTTGNYVATITGGTGVASTAATTGEGTTHTLSIGQAVGTTDNVTFAGVTADAITIGVTAAGEIDTTSGNLTIDSAGGTVTVDDNLTVTGNLTVSGTTTSINTETLTVDDNIIILNNNVTSTPSENAGIEVERGTSANVSVRWNETSDKWEVTNDGTNYGDIVSTYDTGTVSTAMIASDAVTTNKINDSAVTNAKVSATAAIVDTKLATISTAGKVSNSATTATNLDVANAIVARDANGAFSAGSITASLNGNASSATILQTSRNIAGQAFNGSANISIAPTDLTGVTSTAAEINVLDGITSSTAELNILDGVTSSAAEINILDGATLTTTELNYVDGVTSAIQAQIDLKAPLANPTFTGTVAGITSTMVGLGNVNNTSDANKPVSTATQTALDLKAPSANPTFTGTVTGVTATHVGLGSVNNTSDADKPVSTATQTALDLKANLASPTFTGTPTLPTGTIATTQTAGNNTTAVATTAFIQTALGNYRRMTASDTAPSVDVTAGDFWYDTVGLNLYLYFSSAWIQITIDEPIFFELSELVGVVIDEDLATNQTLRFDGISGNWVNSFPRQNVSNSSLTTYGVTSANNGGIVVLDSSSAVSVNLGTWTDANIGEKVDIVQKGTGQVTITVSGAVSVVSPSNSVTTRVRYSTVTATCIGANLFLLSGDLA